MRRGRALLLFTLGYAALALLEPVVAAAPALAVFYAGGLELLRANDPDAAPAPAGSR